MVRRPRAPAGLYRVTQGLHVVTGFAAIPLLLAKLWVVHPRLVEWPPARSVLHAVERLALLPLVGGAAFLLVTGVGNVARWYPWAFFFPRAHFWAAWLTIGGLVVHVGAKGATTLAVVRAAATGAADDRPTDPAPGDRRAFLGAVGAAAAAVAIGTAGGTVAPLSPVSFLAQRRPGDGPQGLPVNKSAASAGVEEAARDPAFRLTVEGAVDRPAGTRPRRPAAAAVADRHPADRVCRGLERVGHLAGRPRAGPGRAGRRRSATGHGDRGVAAGGRPVPELRDRR